MAGSALKRLMAEHRQLMANPPGSGKMGVLINDFMIKMYTFGKPIGSIFFFKKLKFSSAIIHFH